MSPEVLAGRAFCGRAQDAFALGVLLYELLTQTQPFLEAAPSDHRFRLIQEGALPRVLAAQGFRLDARAVDLLSGLLCADPARRLSVEGALAHPWLVAPRALEPAPPLQPPPQQPLRASPRLRKHAEAAALAAKRAQAAACS
jgi:serine/threonine protein kinase